jgi:hypothetical protein
MEGILAHSSAWWVTGASVISFCEAYSLNKNFLAPVNPNRYRHLKNKRKLGRWPSLPRKEDKIQGAESGSGRLPGR